ncbi:histone-fold-containing protein [Nadsonia fulvescens var. elongata DSM 6958]|uniref:Histone-fold-containing protein n=1 Tax=Nadsonia fulvescens var. elongata DSM 6958 TaxID=857566 RepID=A0A1E3PU00_9ASCO|nr:histone-fold-containing protein [Nadsonia fulvescens var. elongata DSM 6958]
MSEDKIPEFELREQDKWLPIANVARIMKNSLPDNAKVSKEAKECMQECVSEFISFITSEASERCSAEKRKTVNGEDILYAMVSLGFENYAEALKIYLAKYRENQNMKQENKDTKSRKYSASQAQALGQSGGPVLHSDNVIEAHVDNNNSSKANNVTTNNDNSNNPSVSASSPLSVVGNSVPPKDDQDKDSINYEEPAATFPYSDPSNNYDEVVGEDKGLYQDYNTPYY